MATLTGICPAKVGPSQVTTLTGLGALPEGQRMAVFYVDVEGFRYAEVAAILDVPLGTIMSRLHRGRHTLRRLLVEQGRERGYPPAAYPAA